MVDRRRVAVIEGDGIGAEVVQAAKTVADAAGARVTWVDAPAGERAHSSVGDRLPRETIALIKECGVALKGPLTNPVVGDASPNIALRVELGLFANVRLARTFNGVPAVFPGTDLVVIREVTEDLFTGAQQWVGPDAAIAVKYVTRAATIRTATFAFDWARRIGRKKVTIIHKATVLKTTDRLFLDASRAVAERFPEIECDEMLVDTVAMQLVRDPHRFDVLLTGFFYGDILADLVSIGTLLAFVVVCIGIMMLRLSAPNARRPFRTPLVWLVAPAGAATSIFLMCGLPLDTWIRLAVWLALGLVIYAAYGRRHSRLRARGAV